jgi:hypothetical protein
MDTNEILNQFSQDMYSIETGLRELETTNNLELDEEQTMDIDTMLRDLQDFIDRLKLLKDKQ